MTRDETKKIIRGMMDIYPSYKPVALAETIDLWASLFKEYPYQLVSAALQAYMMQDNAFAPSPGQLVAMIPKDEIPELEAWGQVRKALRNGTYGAEEEYEKLPEIIQKAVGSPEQLRAWASAPEEETETVMQSNFLRTYRAVKERVKQMEMLPASVRGVLEQAKKGLLEVKHENHH